MDGQDQITHIYGVGPVLEALKAGSRVIERIILANGVRHHRLAEILELARHAGVAIRREDRVVLDRLTENANHQGVAAMIAATRYAREDDVLDLISPTALFVLLDGIEDPHNLGAIVRTAECAGATAVVIPDRRSATVTDAVVKVSAGATEHLPILKVVNLVQFIEELKRRLVWVIAVEASGELVYTSYDYNGPIALVFGSEGHGLHRLVRARCDLAVNVPMHGKIDSLNVSVTTGVVLFEVQRQRAAAAKNDR